MHPGLANICGYGVCRGGGRESLFSQMPVLDITAKKQAAANAADALFYT